MTFFRESLGSSFVPPSAVFRRLGSPSNTLPPAVIASLGSNPSTSPFASSPLHLFLKETTAIASSATYAMPEPLTFLSSILLVTCSDMIPFVPCQPLAIALGSKIGPWAFPICVIGQSLAGVLAFLSARSAADSKQVERVLNSLGSKAKKKFEDFRNIGANKNKRSEEVTVLLALIGLRLAPFFPFSAGNYLLGGATGVGLRPFIIATVLGCLLSNFISVGIGMGGSEILLRSMRL